MAHGLEKVLDDQKRNLNPSDETLHENLRQAIFMNNMLSICMKELIGGECSPAPSPPKMPKHVFERKQWSHTLLKTGRDYLGWLELKVGLRLIRVRGKSKLYKKYLKAKNKKYMKGSRYLLWQSTVEVFTHDNFTVKVFPCFLLLFWISTYTAFESILNLVGYTHQVRNKLCTAKHSFFHGNF